ncbi:MAG: hypothetical protein JO053_08680 [Acidobacteria bacterium]|nr:hypothetical protein [Acidobacteriota bacterium]
MKKQNTLRLLLLAALSLLLSTAAFAQDTRPTPVNDVQNSDPQNARGNLLQQLDLSPDQVRQIRRFNMERRPLMEAAQARLRDANQALDAAIYADNENEADILAKLKEAQTAQAEVARLRSMNELEIRRVLTRDQLVRFRTMRERFKQAQQDALKPKQVKPGPLGNGLQTRPGPMRKLMKQNGQKP